MLIVSCDRYSDVWAPFFHFFFKAWPDCPYPVYLGANRKPADHPRVRSLTIGEDLDYSSNLLQMLQTIPNEWVLVWLDDLFPSKPIDTAAIEQLVATAAARNAAYLKPLAVPPLALGADGEIGELPRGIHYRLSLTVGLWRKSALMRILKPGESAWDIERKASPRSDDFAEPFLALTSRGRRNPPVTVVNGIIKGKWTRPAARLLRREGFAALLPGRQLQSWSSYAYVIAYHLRLRALTLLGRTWSRAS